MMNNRIILSHGFRIAMFSLCVAFLFSSCSKQSGTIPTQQTPTPTPPAAKMEAQSANWKVTVTSVNQIPREPVDPMMGAVTAGPENKYDTLQLTVEIAYTGSPGNIKSPTAALIDGSNHRVEAAKAALETPGAIYMMDYGPNFSSLKTLFTGDGSGNANAAEKARAEKTAKEILSWIDPQVPANNRRPHGLKSGEKFSLIYYFQDPKEYANLKLVFDDVPPIPLNAPHVEKETDATQSKPPSQPTAAVTPLDASMQGQSANWKVMVTSIKKVPNDTTDPEKPRDSLEVRLEIEYVGKPRAIGAPSANLIDGKGNKDNGFLVSSTVGGWVAPIGPPEVPLKSGVTVSATYSFKDPKEYSNLTLMFSDVPAIPLKVP